MSVDLAIADAAVWLMTNAVWLFVVGAVFILGTLCGPSAREVRRLRGQLDQAREDVKDARAHAYGLLYRADFERNRADAAEHRAQQRYERRMTAVDDVLRLAEYELGADWEEVEQ